MSVSISGGFIHHIRQDGVLVSHGRCGLASPLWIQSCHMSMGALSCGEKSVCVRISANFSPQSLPSDYGRGDYHQNDNDYECDNRVFHGSQFYTAAP